MSTDLTDGLTNILKAAAQFLAVARYHGAMPGKHAAAYRDCDVETLAWQGLLERVTFTYGCGQQMQGLRITPEGERLLDQLKAPPDPELATPELAFEHLIILQDVFHFSRMPRYHRMMPEKKARAYAPSDFEDLVNRGYILKMKLKTQGERSHKGYVISGKGERALALAKMI